MRLISCILGALALLCVLGGVANAQGCGPNNPNCIVQTAPPGTNDNRAASTAFVQQNGGNFSLLHGDCTATSLGVITCTKTNGVVFYTGLPSPVNPSDAATVAYVQAVVAAGLIIHSSVVLGTITALSANTYNNGTAGVGATLTANANGALTIDGVAATGSERVLIKNESTASHNGIYVVTATGDGSNPYVLTRSTDANTPGAGNPNQIGAGTFVLVTGGNTLSSQGWAVNNAVTTIGTSAINWAQVSSGVNVSSLNGLSGVLSITNGGGVSIAPSGSAIQLTVAVAQPQGRLTYTTGTPVMTASVPTATTIFYDCFAGKYVPVFNGTTDVILPVGGCEISNAMQASSTGVLNGANVFDEWAINVGGTLTLCTATNGSGGGWASDAGGGSNNARGTGYSQLDIFTRPYPTNANAITHCYTGATDRGTISANQATYLGTFYTTAAGQSSFAYGFNGAPPTPACFCLWNAFNQQFFTTLFGDTRGSWTYGNTQVREADGANNNGAYRAQFVIGMTATSPNGAYQDRTASGTAGVPIVGICVGNTTVYSGAQGGGTSGSGVTSSQQGRFSGFAALGFTFYSACENANSLNTQTFFGNSNSSQWSALFFEGFF